MKGEKNEGRQMVPLFPSLHISGGDKGGRRTNKMTLSQSIF